MTTQKPNWSKLDSGMLTLLSDVLDGTSPHDLDARDVSLFVETKSNLSKYALRIVKKLRVHISRSNQQIGTANLSIREIIQLSRRRFIVKLTKSRQLSPF